MNLFDNNNLGKLFLRICVGFLLLFHGFTKILHKTTYIEKLLFQNDLPTFLVYGVYISEFVSAIFIILGFYTRINAFIIIISMLFSIFLVHINNFFIIDNYGSWSLEAPLFFLLGSLSILFLGAGKYTLKK